MHIRLHSDFCKKNCLSFGHGGNKLSPTCMDSFPFRARTIDADHSYPLASCGCPELSVSYDHVLIDESVGLAAGQRTGRSRTLLDPASVQLLKYQLCPK